MPSNRWGAVALVLTSWSCSSPTSPGGAGPAGATDSATDETSSADTDVDTLVADVAPEAPACGTKVGDILCDLDVQGYVRNETTGLATSAPFGPFKISEAIATGTQPYAFVFNTAFW